MKFNEGNQKKAITVVNNIDLNKNNDSISLEIDNSSNNIDLAHKNSKFTKVPLTEEEKNLTGIELGKKYNLSKDSGYLMKITGVRIVNNPNYISNEGNLKKEREEKIKFLDEITPVEINSIETVLGNEKEQQKVREISSLFDEYRFLKSEITKDSIYNKKYKLLSGQELTFGDFFVLNKIIESKMFRNQEGNLMIFNNDENKFIPFKRNDFLSKRGGFYYKDINKKVDESRHTIYSLENIAPNIFKTGLFNEKDFDYKVAGSPAFEIYGPHERKLTPNTPNAFLSNSETSAKYYIGRENFSGKDKKINHDTVRISLLDDKTGVVIDTINGKKSILYTFPLITKEEYEKQKEKILSKRVAENKSTNININDYITEKAKLKEYSISNYITKNINESDKDYIDKISRLSDTSYVLGNFKSFMSETGLAANNYSWREQLILADALTSVEDENKIINLGKNFGKDGMRTFLSIEQGGKEMGNKILALGERLPEDVVNKVFLKYSDIIDIVDNSEEEIKKIFGDKDVPIRVLTSVKETLLKRGAKMLSDLGDKVLDSKFELNENEILKELDEIKEETIILGESYVGLYKEGIRVPIEDVTTIKETPTEKLTDEQKKELVKIYEKGRPKVTYDKKGHLEFLKKEFEDELNDKDISITEICFKNETIVIALVDRKEKDSLYIGGLTFVEDVKNAVVAEATMSHVLEKFKDKNIRALVDSRNPILRMYMNRFGFKITKKLDSEEEIKNNGGEIYYEIERPKEYVLEERQEFKNVA